MKNAATPLLLVLLAAARTALGDDWPQWRGPDRDAVWREAGLVETFPKTGLAARWRARCGPGYSSPIVGGGRVYLTESVPEKPQARERVRCFDEVTGEVLWEHAHALQEFPDFAFDYRRSDDPTQPPHEAAGVAIGVAPAATPIVRDGRLYTLGRCGQLCCLDAACGAVLWETPLEAGYGLAKWSCTASPLIEGGLLIVFIGGKPGADVVAFDTASGREVWRALSEGVTHSSPIVLEHGGRRQLIVWTKQSVTALKPLTGATLWRERLFTASDYAVSTPVTHDGLLLVGGLMLALDPGGGAPRTLWPDSRAVTRRVLSNTSTAMLRDTHLYSARSSGTLVCLEAATGVEVWATDAMTPLQRFAQSGASIHLTANGDTTLLYNDQGELIRARLTPKGCEEIGRVRIARPVNPYGGLKLAWPPPAFANGHVFARTDEELVCVALRSPPRAPR